MSASAPGQDKRTGLNWAVACGPQCGGPYGHDDLTTNIACSATTNKHQGRALGSHLSV